MYINEIIIRGLAISTRHMRLIVNWGFPKEDFNIIAITVGNRSTLNFIL